jgi:type IV pilus assembly protein PilA
MMKQKRNGFTLVEIIVVLIILAILAAILIPLLTGYIDKANKSAALAECRAAVVAAQTLYTENYVTGNTVTIANIKTLSEVPGEITDVEAVDGVVMHLTYTNYKHTVTYCRDFENCADHDAQYNFEDGSASSDDPEDPDDPGNSDDPEDTEEYANTIDYFYIAGDPNYLVYTWGDLTAYDPKNGDEPGTVIPTGTIFYYEGGYYYTRYDQYLTASTNLDQYLATYGVSVDIDEFTTPSPSSQPGDLKIENGTVYVFFPMSTRYYEDYYAENCWFEVTIN